MSLVALGKQSFLILAAFGLMHAPGQGQALPDAVNARLQAGQPVYARSWHGKTLAERADEYEQYLGGRISLNMPKIKGNLGFEFHRLDPIGGDGKYVEFEVVSYWPSLKAIQAFAGADITEVHDAPRDNEFLVDKETKVRNYRILARTTAAAPATAE